MPFGYTWFWCINIFWTNHLQQFHFQRTISDLHLPNSKNQLSILHPITVSITCMVERDDLVFISCRLDSCYAQETRSNLRILMRESIIDKNVYAPEGSDLGGQQSLFSRCSQKIASCLFYSSTYP